MAPSGSSSVPNSWLRVVVILALGRHRRCAAERVEAALRKPLETFCLGQEDSSKSALNLPLRDHLRKAGEDQRSPGNAKVGMRPELEHAIGDDPPTK